MNNKKNLIYSIIAVLLIGLIVSGSTFAYFQWTSGIDDRAGLNITIEQSGITMHIEPENTVYTNLRPTAYCNNAYAYGDALVTVVNNTGAAAVPSFKLKVKVTKNGTGELTQDILSHIHYSVVVPNQDEDGDLVGTEQPLCNHLIADSFSDDDSVFFKSNSTDTWTNQFNFGSVNTDGSWTHVPNNGDATFYFDSNNRIKQGDDYISNPAYLPRQYYVGNYNGNSKGDTKGITFIAAPHATTTQRLRVYVWIDEHYTATNIGGVVSDPLQNAKIEVTWSEQSTVQQVPSESTGGEEEVKEPGGYDSQGNLTTWDTLVANGDITVSDDGVLINSNKDLTGELIIPESVTSIGNQAFWESKLTNVIIPDSVTSIGESAFVGSQITSVILPDTVTSIGSSAFSCTELTSIVISDSVTSIEMGTFDASYNLSNVVMGKSIVSIGMFGFSHTSIESIVIPKTLTKVDQAAFYNTKLTDVYYEGTEEEWNAINIDNTNNGNAPLINANIHYNYTGE